MAGMRVCPVCGKDFYDNSKSHSKLTCSLKCRNAYYYQDDERKFNRSVQMRLNIMKQNGVEFDGETIERIKTDLKIGKCMICGRERKKSERDFHIDHDHDTGEYRGILCPKHNHAAGNVNNSPLEAIALCKYLIAKNARGIDWKELGQYIIPAEFYETTYGAK